MASSDSFNPYFDFPVVTQNPNTLVISFPAPTLPQLNNLFCTLFCTSGPISTGGFNQTFATGAVTDQPHVVRVAARARERDARRDADH